MNSSLYTGVLGLQAHQTKMDVIGNNIANVNTYGFKRGRAAFADLLSRTYQGATAPRGNLGGTNALQVGLGVTTASITNIMAQGQMETTGRQADVMINGNGWFVLKSGNGENVYTRDGSFALDKNGTYVNANGWQVQGWTTVKTDNDHNFTVDTSRPVTNIDFQPGEKLAAEATNKVGVKSNLKSDSRSLIADGLDPKEGYAVKDDKLVDLYKLDTGEFTPTHLGLREGDWLEVKTKVTYNQVATAATATGAGIAGQQAYSIISNGNIPVRINSVSINGVPTYTAATLVTKDPDLNNDGVIDNLAAAEWVYDSGSGRITLGTAPAANDVILVDYTSLETCKNTMPYQETKYNYVQVTNDTNIADLETTIQQTLDTLDVNGTINAEVKYDPAMATFTVYNNAVDGTRDRNTIDVSVNAVSGSAIRRGFLLQDSTDKNVNGTQLSLGGGNLGGKMDPETIGIVDYQNDVTNLDYGMVDNSEQIYGEVVNARVWTTYAGATHNNGISLAGGEWSGYTNSNQLQLMRETDMLTVNGTVWNRVSFFSGAANEYVITDGNETTPPTVFFNTAASLQPSDGASVVMRFRPSNAPKIQLTENTSYTIDSTTGRISLMWSGASSDPNRMLGQGVGSAQLTGDIKLTANYTTEKRLMDPPSKVMDNRWADFAQGLAEVNESGDGKARTEFNKMWGNIATGITTTPIMDQATSAQPTAKTSNRFLSADIQRTSITTYDSLGEAHDLQLVFTHVGSYYDTSAQAKYTNEWFWRAELPYEDMFSFDSMDYIDGQTQSVARRKGDLQFSDDGLLQATKLAGNTGPITFDASPIGLNGNSTGSVKQTGISLDFVGHSGQPIDGLTQYASDGTAMAFEQNGWAMGTLDNFSIDQSGIISGRYSNNIVKPIAQLALAMFPNEEGMTKLGNNVFSISANSGTPTVVASSVMGAGLITGSALEMSNVDIAQEFTNMIVTERGFQANSRVITTSDEMLTEVINMKR